MTKFGISLLVLLILLVTSINGVHAWGVAYSENQISLKPSQTYSIRTSLQNMVGDDEILIYISLKGDTEIAELSEKEVLLQPQTNTHPVYINITIPEENYKTKYNLQVTYTEKAKGGIMVNIATEKVVNYVINIKEKQQENIESSGSSGSSSRNTQTITQNEEQEEQEIQPEQEEQENNSQVPIIAVPNEKTTEDNIPEQKIEDNMGIFIMAIILIGIISSVVMWWLGWI